MSRAISHGSKTNKENFTDVHIVMYLIENDFATDGYARSYAPGGWDLDAGQ